MSGFAPSAEWPERWHAALASVGIAEPRSDSEQLALDAIRTFRSTPPRPRNSMVRAVSAELPAVLRRAETIGEILRAAAAGTPDLQAERRAKLDQLSYDVAVEMALDPDGGAHREWPTSTAVTPWGCMADRVERAIADAALDELPPAPPRASNPAFDVLIAGLGLAYAQATGRRPTAFPTLQDAPLAPFIRFLHALWPEISDRPRPTWKPVNAALERQYPFPASELPQEGIHPANQFAGIEAGQ